MPHPIYLYYWVDRFCYCHLLHPHKAPPCVLYCHSVGHPLIHLINSSARDVILHLLIRVLMQLLEVR